ncbi:MAG: GNAT family N-acetyltransferase [Chloroflexota bacterium]
MSNYYVERATIENVQDVWTLNELEGGSHEARAALVDAARDHACLVARSGWNVRGFLIRQASFFGYPLVSRVVVHPDERRQGVGRLLMDYAEKTTPEDRLFAAVRGTNEAGTAFVTALGYTQCGEVSALHADDVPEVIYVKHL